MEQKKTAQVQVLLKVGVKNEKYYSYTSFLMLCCLKDFFYMLCYFNLVKIGTMYPSLTIKGEKMIRDYCDIVCSTKLLVTTGNSNQQITENVMYDVMYDVNVKIKIETCVCCILAY